MIQFSNLFMGRPSYFHQTQSLHSSELVVGNFRQNIIFFTGQWQFRGILGCHWQNPC